MKKLSLIVCLLCCLSFILPAVQASAEELDQSIWSYNSETLTITIERVQEEYSTKKLTYFIADIIVKDPSQFFTAFAKDEYTKSGREDTESIADRNDAVLAINGDYYNHDVSIGITLRNGELFRDKHAPRDILIVDANGDMNVILRGDRGTKKERLITGEELAAEGAWQVFEFGPALIANGQACELPENGKYFIYTNERIREPRTVIGQIAPLHYVVLVADGRRDNWSDEGMRFPDMQEVLLARGCQTAYNLDGGGSTTLFFDGEIINKPAGGKQRQVSDIVCFGE